MKKIISMLLVLAMMITVLTVGIATTNAAETATITIYGPDGTSEVKEVNVGDEFTVYTTLNVNGMVASVEGTQTYSSDVIQLRDSYDSDSGEIADLITVFPVTGDVTYSNASTAGKILYNASAPSVGNGFKFDSADSKLIVTTYKVTAAGTGEVRNTIKNLAAADANLTKIVFNGQLQDGQSVGGKATFTDPAPATDKAIVTLHKLDGSTEVKEVNVGDTFTVYTMLNASAVNGGNITSVNGSQRFTSSILSLQDSVDEDGYIENLTTVFPTMGNNAIAAVSDGTIMYSGSSTAGFLFSSDNSQLITTTYKATAPGYAAITNKINTLAVVEDDTIRIVFNGETQDGVNFAMPASFYPPGEAPTNPPTQPPTQGPTTEPTQAPTKLNVTIINPDNTTVQKTFNINDTFTVYTVLNTGGKIASIDGTQTYPTASLQLTDAVNGEYNEVTDKAAMFPILGDEALATVNNGTIKFNATRGTVNGGYAFDTAESKLIVTNYKVLAAGDATIKTSLKTLIKDDAAATKIVFNSETQDGQSYSMPGSFTDPGNPELPTEPATEPAPATEPPTEPVPSDRAVVTIYGFDGTSATRTYNIGDEFTVYTTFDPVQFNGIHGIASISAAQTFTGSVLQFTDEIDEVEAVVDTEAMFPVFGNYATAKITNIDGEGLNKYNASIPGLNKGFVFDEENPLIIVTNYKVIAAGNAEVRNSITTLGADNAALTRIVNKGVIADGYEIGGIASFTDPTQPEPPTEPPTEPAPATEPPTEPAAKATVTVYGLDGVPNTKTYDVGEEFTVYTALEVGDTAIASINATQTFTSSVLMEVDDVDILGVVSDNEAMFPVFGNSAMARITDGTIKYNASTPTVGNGFVFTPQNPLLIVTTYVVTAAGEAEIRNSLTTVAAANEDLTRIVDNGVVAPGMVIDTFADFVDPSQPENPTQPATDNPGETYLLGDADDNGEVETLDCTILQKYLAWMDLDVDDAIVERNGDVDFSGEIETIDITWIQKYLAWYDDIPYPIDEYVTGKP